MARSLWKGAISFGLVNVPVELHSARRTSSRADGIDMTMLDMALRLVEDMADTWQPAKNKDTYRDDLLKRIKEKVKAGETEELTEPEKDAEKPAKGADVIDLMSLLKQSVERKPKPARRSIRKRRAA